MEITYVNQKETHLGIGRQSGFSSARETEEQSSVT
jgi:hypothetical protein